MKCPLKRVDLRESHYRHSACLKGELAQLSLEISRHPHAEPIYLQPLMHQHLHLHHHVVFPQSRNRIPQSSNPNWPRIATESGPRRRRRSSVSNERSPPPQNLTDPSTAYNKPETPGIPIVLKV
jgi:hypothetical protein